MEKCGSIEERCVEELELEIVKRKREYEALEAKFRAMEIEKLALEEEIKALKREGDGVEKQVNGGEDEEEELFGGGKGVEGSVDPTEDSMDGDKVFQLMIENKVLDCEKKKAESEVAVWKEKFEKLESKVLKLDKNLVLQGGEMPFELEDGSPHHVGYFEDSRTLQPNKRIKLADGLHVESSLECSKDLSSGKGSCDLQPAGSPCNDTPCVHRDGTKKEKKAVCMESDMKYASKSQARKQLKFEEPSPCKKMAPSTPGGGVPSSLGVIDITDSDDEVKITNCDSPLTDNQGSKKACISAGSVLEDTVGFEADMTLKKRLKRTHTDHTVGEVAEDSNEAFMLGSTAKRKHATNIVTSDSETSDVEEDADPSNEAFLLGSTPKRKRASNIVTSDSESSDDNIPIRKLKRMHLQEKRHGLVGSDLNEISVTASAAVVDSAMGTVTPSRPRLVRLRRYGERDGVERNYSSQTSETKSDGKGAEADELEEVGSESEGESLGGFIVNSSDSEGDASNKSKDSSDSEGSNDSSTKSKDRSDDDVDFDEILSKFQRNKDHKSGWEFEADMLSAFGKDPELCMKAVCALYRQQTGAEKYVKESLCTNSRGFSKFDALRGSILAEFLCNGDPNGDLKKTVEELEEYDPRGIETCRTLASRYSKQLFEIYKNKEDPLFLPSV